MVKNLPAMQETQVQSLDWEDPLEEGMATHSSVLAWRIPRTEEPGGLQSIGSHRVEHDGSDLAQHTKNIKISKPSGVCFMYGALYKNVILFKMAIQFSNTIYFKNPSILC